ncbi:MAG: [FeFe] hydrogenase H-cluster radical SAM maturase HydE [Clostridium sp.]|nr:[FeFe] hydrogenase H-cluster radical SAM maturase HydE [Clostridium sp.]MCM1398275.1 [FeFe] hydrogenase H-cluster radical SAM maturase HydE [Clostridium sp.]MCM1459061.1 [FeFe] hydrogenase H-cluster radical SAM maturase HydE [Bacteroides sp.]
MQEADKLISGEKLTHGEYVRLVEGFRDENVRETLQKEAVHIRSMHYGRRVFIRGLIEFTNYCRNGCFYCGINSSCTDTNRYRLTKEEILTCCLNGYQLGFRTFVLQGGEDMYFTDDILVDIISTIKNRFPDCAITLSIGEREYASYERLKKAGADRYLLRHETADEMHYRQLHPSSMSLSNRKKCLYDLKALGYQVGAGFMVGSPKQTSENIASDLEFLNELKPHMIGIGPFIPHHATRFANEEQGSVELTLHLLTILRIMFPKVLLPATTALGTAKEDGRERGILAGANVVMPNLSPKQHRQDYALYNNKICTGDEAAECIEKLRQKFLDIGYEIVCDRGDYPAS